MKNHEKIFRRNKLKDLILVLISSILAAGGYLVLEKNLLMGWLSIFFFGIIITIFLIQIFTNVSYIKLNAEGFEERTLLRTKCFKWKDVSNFEIRSFRWNKSIHFDHKDKFGSYNWKSILSSYSIKAKDLIKLMNQYKNDSKKLLQQDVKIY